MLREDGAYGILCLLPPSTFHSIEWPTLNPFTIDEFGMRMNKNIQVDMKFTFGLNSIGSCRIEYFYIFKFDINSLHKDHVTL